MAKKQGLRILHCGDIYLGRPFPDLPAQSSERRRGDIKQTLKDLLRYVEEQQVHLVLISGNLFDFDYVSYENVSWVMREMERMSFARFMIAPGVSDKLDKQCFYSVCQLPKNVHVFSEKPEIVKLPKWKINVFGWGLSVDQKDNWPMTKFTPDEGETYLVCGCLGAGGKEGVRVSEEEIASSGVVYMALSGDEGFHGFTQVGNTVVAESGLLESGSFTHLGFGGANLLTLLREGDVDEEIEQESRDLPEQLPEAEQMTYFESPEQNEEESDQIAEEEQKPHAEFDVFGGKLVAERLTFGMRRYVTETLNISGMTDIEEVEQAVYDLVRQKGYGEDTSLCVVLEGRISPDFVPPRLRDHTVHGLAELFSMDKSVPHTEEDYGKDMTVRGELLRAMMPKILNNDEKTRENAIKALRIAFLALDNNDPHHI